MTSTKKTADRNCNSWPEVQNFKCNYSLASTLKKKICIYNIEKKTNTNNFWIFFSFYSEKLKDEKKILFSHLLCCHMVSRKKKLKNISTIKKKIYHLNFFLAFTAKKNEFSCPKKWNNYSGKNITLKTANLISPKQKTTF